MNLEVVLLPDPERFRAWAYKRGHPAPTPGGIAHRSGKKQQAAITCFGDVRNWANEIHSDVANGGGPYFFKLYIRALGKPFMEYEMPHGDMILEDRLWIPIDMYEAFYVEVT
jgi:hypothetical protein